MSCAVQYVVHGTGLPWVPSPCVAQQYHSTALTISTRSLFLLPVMQQHVLQLIRYAHRCGVSIS